MHMQNRLADLRRNISVRRAVLRLNPLAGFFVSGDLGAIGAVSQLCCLARNLTNRPARGRRPATPRMPRSSGYCWSLQRSAFGSLQAAPVPFWERPTNSRFKRPRLKSQIKHQSRQPTDAFHLSASVTRSSGFPRNSIVFSYWSDGAC